MARSVQNWVIGLAVLLGGCAHAPKPDDQLVSSEASVRTAQELGAQSIPRAALALQLAEDELQHAKDLTKSGDNEKASLQLMRCKVDADLALALTKSTRALADADAAQAELKTLNHPSSVQ